MDGQSFSMGNSFLFFPVYSPTISGLFPPQSAEKALMKEEQGDDEDEDEDEEKDDEDIVQPARCVPGHTL